MARSEFGGTPGDTVWGKSADGSPFFSAATITCWTAQFGGVQYNDLLLAGQAVSQITVGDDAQIPVFQGPDSVTQLWVSADDGPRVVLRAAGSGGTSGGGGGTGPVALDTDGTPYYAVDASTKKRLVTEPALATAQATKLDAALFTAFDNRPVRRADTTTGTWPARLSTALAGWSGPVIWDSVDYERSSGNAASAPSGAVDGDRWRSKL